MKKLSTRVMPYPLLRSVQIAPLQQGVSISSAGDFFPGLGHASICPDQCAYDTNNSRVERQCVRI